MQIVVCATASVGRCDLVGMLHHACVTGSKMQKTNVRCICSQVGTFSVSSVCPGSPSLPDKAKHNREVMILLPSHRERANNSVYYNMAENGQVGETPSGATPDLFCLDLCLTLSVAPCRTTTCSVPYFNKLAPVSRVLILT